MDYFIDQVLNGLSLGTIYALIALGFAMVYGILRLLNFAHSEVFTTGSFIGYFILQWALSDLSLPPVIAVILALLGAGMGCSLLALLIERIAYRPLRGQPRIRALLTALSLSIFLQSLGIELLTAHTRGYPAVALPVTPRQMAVCILMASYVLLHAVIFRTKIGIQIRAVAENPEVAMLMGVRSTQCVILTFVLGGMFAGFAGVTWGLLYGTLQPQMGFYPGLKAFIIAVMGGIGNLNGTFLMGLMLGVLEVLGAAYLPSQYSSFEPSLIFALLLFLLIYRPTGLYAQPNIAKV